LGKGRRNPLGRAGQIHPKRVDAGWQLESALTHLNDGGGSSAFNLAAGRGSSVLAMVDCS
jgi:hypothetical protein